jgi:hypothetical protein
MAPAEIGSVAKELLENVLLERTALAECHRAIALTEDDARFADRVLGACPIVIPTGISDHAILRPLLAHGPNPDAAIVPHSAVFIGYYAHYPNRDAVRWYIENIHFRVLERVPDYRCFIVGLGDLSEFYDVARRESSIVLRGRVKDVTGALLEAQVGLAPLISGAGFRGKINQYSAVGRPTVATTLASSGLPYRDGESIFVADTPWVFADATVRLLTDPKLWTRMRDNALAVAREHFSWSRLIPQYEALYEE